MWMTKLKSIAAMIALTLILAGSGLLAHQVLAEQPAEVAQVAEPKAPAPPPAAEKGPRAAKLDLTPQSLPKVQALIRPQEHEWRWLRVHWLTDVVAARKKAAAEDKPLAVV